MKRDIETEAHIREIVDAFYGGIEAEPAISRFFEGVDLPGHLPKMYAFWSSVVLHTGAYGGRPFDPHAHLPGLAPEHFGAWIERFHRTIDARFAGPVADEMKAKASQIGSVFQWKLGLLTFVENT